MKTKPSISAAPGGRTTGGELAPPTAAPGILSDADLGRQLTAQYHRAVSGMREVLLFGAMLMQVEEKVTVSTRGHGGRFGDKGAGLKGWLEQYAPEISRPTAYRFLGITRSIAAEYEQIVGARVAKTYDLPALVLTPAADLPEHAQLKQGELFDFVSGTSQRSWLDQFKGDLRQQNGGKRERPNGTKRRTADMKDFDDKTDAALSWYQEGLIYLRDMQTVPQWRDLPDVELANIADLLKLLAKHADEVCRVRRIVPTKLRDWDKEPL